MSETAAIQAPIRTTVPARLDRLGWSPFHTRMVCGLGAAWILDGLQITIASSVTGVLTQSDTLGHDLDRGRVHRVGLPGRRADRRVGLREDVGPARAQAAVDDHPAAVPVGTGLAAFVTGHHTGWLVFFYATRLIAGMGIGGQYAAINSAIDEMMPSKYRGRVDIWINGSYWAGAILGSFASLIFLNAFAVNVGWRLAFLMGPVLALVVIVVARVLPESPRWLMTHGRVEEAEAELAKIEAVQGQQLEPVSDDLAIELMPEKQYGYLQFLRLVFHTYPKRAILGATLMITQSFLYNAIFFTYALVLTKFYDVSATSVPLYGLAFSIGNLIGPLVLAPLFDTVGRQEDDLGHLPPVRHLAGRRAPSCSTTGRWTRPSQTFVWCVIFFFASAGASAAYLTVSETWPIEIRSEAIAVFFAIGTIAGALGPAFYGALIGDGTSRTGLFIGYLVGAGIMAIGGVVEWFLGIDAEGNRSRTSPSRSPRRHRRPPRRPADRRWAFVSYRPSRPVSTIRSLASLREETPSFR